MNKYVITSLTAVCMLGFSACNSQNNAEQRYSDRTSPIGVYSNEKNDRDGNGRLVDHKQGPVAEYVEYANDGNDNRNHDTITNESRPYGYPYSNKARDVEYRGPLNTSDDSVVKAPVTKTDERKAARQIENKAEQVKGVKNAHAIFNGNRLLVAIKTNETNRTNVEKNVKNAIAPMTKPYQVVVKADDRIYNEAKQMKQDMKKGLRDNVIHTNMNGLFESIDQNVNGNGHR
ncbi:YhcN/YlaJ family sporulation lipoprotein [Priestia koreensis]|uniref:YhcN/YlaJ family sporulation lipoprotein n=1 Tax=Priestia koreensis TaxID=284581 RepID=UPI0006A98889|nr:YhcN/YlaJ family sporulation lipoprotein [Priestia koreensis]